MAADQPQPGEAATDRKPPRRIWLPPVLILTPPWVAAAVTLALVDAHRLFPSWPWPTFLIYGPAGNWLGLAHLVLAMALSAYGGLFVRGPLPTRVAAVIAISLYAASIYLILWTVGRAIIQNLARGL